MALVVAHEYLLGPRARQACRIGGGVKEDEEMNEWMRVGDGDGGE